MPSRTIQSVTSRVDQSRRKATPAKLSFPVNGHEVGYGMLFKIQSYKFSAGTSSTWKAVEMTTGAHIFLPMPSSLQESLSHDYATPELGLARAGYNAANDAADALANAGAGAMMSSLGNTATGVGEYLIRQTINRASPELGGLINASTGTVPNPYATVQYTRTNQRNHQFEWKLSPMSKEDSDALFEIVNTFRYYSLPTMEGLYLQFPHEFEISFIGSPQLYGLSKCVLTDMQVNYAPHGTPSFFAMSGAPNGVSLTLSFRELEPMSKNALDGGNYAPQVINVPSGGRGSMPDPPQPVPLPALPTPPEG